MQDKRKLRSYSRYLSLASAHVERASRAYQSRLPPPLKIKPKHPTLSNNQVLLGSAQPNAMSKQPLVVFIHLDLGIGGAESLVLNLAKSTLPSSSDHQNNNSATNEETAGKVSIYTTHCSPTHCYM